MKMLRYLFLSLITITLVVSCEDDEDTLIPDAPTPIVLPPDMEIYPTAVFVQEPDTDLILPSDEDGAVMTISSSQLADTLSINDVIVSGMSETFPFGIMRRVTNITSLGNGSIGVETEAAALTDFIKEGRITLEGTLRLADTIRTRSLDTFEFKLSHKIVLYDLDGNLSRTKNDQLRVEIDLDINGDYLFDYYIANGQLEYAEVNLNTSSKIGAKLLTDIGLQSRAALQQIPDIEQVVPIVKYEMLPVSVPSMPLIVFTPTFKIDLKAQVALESKLKVGVSRVEETFAAYRYFKQTGFESQFFTEGENSPLDFEVGADLAASVGAAVTFEAEMNKLVTAGIELGSSLKAEVGVFVSNGGSGCPYEVSANTEVKGFIKGKILDRSLFEYLATLPIYKEVIAEGEWCEDEDSGTFVDDRDGQTYRWVRIGDQVWMAENLNYQVGQIGIPSNLAPINPRVPDFVHLDTFVYYRRNTTSGENAPNNDEILNGRGYSDQIPSGIQGLCPFGWHVPSSAEWDLLYDNFSNYEQTGRLLIDTSVLWYKSVHWRNFDELLEEYGPLAGEMSSGFNAQPDGMLELGTETSTVSSGVTVYYATSTESARDVGTLENPMEIVNILADGIGRIAPEGSYAVACRCVRDQ